AASVSPFTASSLPRHRDRNRPSGGAAAYDEGGALRPDRVHVAQRPGDPDAARDSGLVEPAEAAADHPGGGAVAARARTAETEAGQTRQLARVDGSAEDGSAVDVGARVEVDLGYEVAPV